VSARSIVHDSTSSDWGLELLGGIEERTDQEGRRAWIAVWTIIRDFCDIQVGSKRELHYFMETWDLSVIK
jgi:hypothetical protein